MTNNDLINIEQLAYVVLAAIITTILLYRFNKKAKEIMGTFALFFVFVWEDIRDWFRS